MKLFRLIGLAAIGFTAFKLVQSRRSRRLFHVILFKFKNGVRSHEIQNAEASITALKEEIELIESLEFGANLPHEHRNKGFTHCAIYTFKNKKDFKAYKDHSAHDAFLERITPLLEDSLVIDFYPD